MSLKARILSAFAIAAAASALSSSLASGSEKPPTAVFKRGVDAWFGAMRSGKLACSYYSQGILKQLTGHTGVRALQSCASVAAPKERGIPGPNEYSVRVHSLTSRRAVVDLLKPGGRPTGVSARFAHEGTQWKFDGLEDSEKTGVTAPKVQTTPGPAVTTPSLPLSDRSEDKAGGLSRTTLKGVAIAGSLLLAGLAGWRRRERYTGAVPDGRESDLEQEGGATPPSTARGLAPPAPSHRVSVAEASESDLAAVPELGPDRARRLVAARAALGAPRDVAALAILLDLRPHEAAAIAPHLDFASPEVHQERGRIVDF